MFYANSVSVSNIPGAPFLAAGSGLKTVAQIRRRHEIRYVNVCGWTADERTGVGGRTVFEDREESSQIAIRRSAQRQLVSVESFDRVKGSDVVHGHSWDASGTLCSHHVLFLRRLPVTSFYSNTARI